MTEPSKASTAPYFSEDTPPETQGAPLSLSPTASEECHDRGRKCDDTRQPSDATNNATSTLAAGAATETEPQRTGDVDRNRLSSGAGAGTTDSGGAGSIVAVKKHPEPRRASSRSPPVSTAHATDQARNERLCQAIADRVEVRFEGRGGKLALRAPRRRGEGSGGAGASGGHRSFGGGIGGGGEGATGMEEREGEDEDGNDEGGDGGGDSGGELYGGEASGGGGRGLGSDELGSQEKGKVRWS